MQKVCIISCGMIANSAHFPQDFEIAGVCDVNTEAARSTAERHGIERWYTDAETMLREIRPNAVSICVPNALHKELACLALSYGCHVLCEKPLAFNGADAREMFGLAKKANRVLMACQSMRFTPDRLAARSWIERGEAGRIYFGELVRVRPRGYHAESCGRIGDRQGQRRADRRDIYQMAL